MQNSVKNAAIRWLHCVYCPMSRRNLVADGFLGMLEGIVKHHGKRADKMEGLVKADDQFIGNGRTQSSLFGQVEGGKPFHFRALLNGGANVRV